MCAVLRPSQLADADAVVEIEIEMEMDICIPNEAGDKKLQHTLPYHRTYLREPESIMHGASVRQWIDYLSLLIWAVKMWC